MGVYFPRGCPAVILHGHCYNLLVLFNLLNTVCKAQSGSDPSNPDDICTITFPVRVCVRVRVVQNFDQTMAPLAAASDPQAEAESKLSLHFNLTDIKSALTDVRERMDEIRTGNTRSRGSLGSSNALNH